MTIAIPKVTTGESMTCFGPTSFSVTNHAGKGEVSGTFAVTGWTTAAVTRWDDETMWSPFEAFSSAVGYLYGVSAQVYNEIGGQVSESRSYFASVTSGMETKGAHYDATTFAFDDNFTLAYDAAGNMTDDSRNYEYVWDGFGRLRQVKRTDNQTLVAEHRYNGLGYRLSWRYDTDGDLDVGGSNET